MDQIQYQKMIKDIIEDKKSLRKVDFANLFIKDKIKDKMSSISKY